MTQVIIKNDGVGERMPLSETELGLTTRTGEPQITSRSAKSTSSPTRYCESP